VYRDPSEPKEWEAKDPLERWRRYLETRKLWTQELHDKYSAEITEELMTAVKRAGELGNPAPETMFDDVFSDVPPHLQEQRAEMMALPRPKSGHGGH
jgi:TPP-dependent pyruvate/acetoin dehydrogenase alpha subunit